MAPAGGSQHRSPSVRPPGWASSPEPGNAEGLTPIAGPLIYLSRWHLQKVPVATIELVFWAHPSLLFHCVKSIIDSGKPTHENRVWFSEHFPSYLRGLFSHGGKGRWWSHGTMGAGHWFSAWGSPSPQGHLALSGDVLGCHGCWGGGEGKKYGICWVEARDADKVRAAHRTVPP